MKTIIRELRKSNRSFFPPQEGSIVFAKFRKTRIFIFIFLMFMNTACEKDMAPKRVYQEIIMESPQQASMSLMKQAAKTRTTEIPVVWTTPAGWTQMEGSGFRLVSFQNSVTPEAVDCSIVSLAGDAGGIPSNVVRWMRQLSMTVPSDEELNQFLNAQERFATDGKLSGLMIDLSQNQSAEEPAAAGMLAAVIEIPDAVIFVKMTGTRQNLQNNRKQFTEVYQSIRLKTPSE